MVLSSMQLQKVSVTLWFHRLQWLVLRSVLSVFINRTCVLQSVCVHTMDFVSAHKQIYYKVAYPCAESSNSMNLSMTVGQAACQLLCRHTQSMLAASCVCWIVPIVTCDSQKKFCPTDGWQGCEPHPPPAKLNVKTGPLPSLYFRITIFWFE